MACYFEKRWFLLIFKDNSAILTFLSLGDATDEDRQLLKHDERYCRINDDAFRVFGRDSISNAIIYPTESSVDLPPEEELPSDVHESAVKLMKKLCEN